MERVRKVVGFIVVFFMFVLVDWGFLGIVCGLFWLISRLVLLLV